MAVYIFCPNCKKRRPARDKCPECALQFKGKALSYTIEYYVNRKPVRESLGKVSKDTAFRMERKRRTEIAEGNYTAFEKSRPLADVFDDYVSEKLSGHWAQEAKGFLDLMVEEWPDIKVNELTLYMVRAYRKKLVDKGGRKPNTIDRHMACARAAWNYACLKETNPFAQLKPFNPKSDFPRLLTQKQEHKFLAVTKKDYRMIYEMAVLSICTGLRQREIYNLQWSELDLESGYAYVRGKGDKPHVVRLNELATGILTGIQKNGSAYVWSNPQTGRPYTTLKTAWKTIKTKAGLPGWFRWHDMRHIAASKLINAGASLSAVQKFLNHTDSRTTEMYAHLMPEYLDDLVSKITLHEDNPESTHTKEHEED